MSANHDDDVDDELTRLTSQFTTLCSHLSTRHLPHLSRQTQSHLLTSTRSIFTSWATHGSEPRLAQSLLSFLSRGNEALDFFPDRPLPTKPDWKKLRTVDAESAELVTSLPLRLDLEIEIKEGTTIPPYILLALDRIVGLFEAEAEAMLTHLTQTYGNEPIFRSGVREFYTSQLSSILTSTASDTLSLTPETRSFLRKVYDRHGPELNDVEARLLARAGGVDGEGVDLFFEDLEAKRRGYWGMRQVILAKELGRLRRERRLEDEGMGGMVASDGDLDGGIADGSRMNINMFHRAGAAVS